MLGSSFPQEGCFCRCWRSSIVYAGKVFRGKVGGGCVHEVGAVRDGGVLGDEDARVATNAVYSFDNPTAVWCLQECWGCPLDGWGCQGGTESVGSPSVSHIMSGSAGMLVLAVWVSSSLVISHFHQFNLRPMHCRAGSRVAMLALTELAGPVSMLSPRYKV